MIRKSGHALSDLLSRSWPHESGARLGLAKLAIDTGGEFTAEVYAWSRRQGSAQVMPVKGVERFDRPQPVSGPSYVDATEGGRKIRRGAKLWTVAVSTFKAETYRWLWLDRPTDEALDSGGGYADGFVHLPRGIEAEWVKQLVAEQLVTVNDRRGFARHEWRKLRERNEALDCRVYARAALWVLGADRYGAGFWKRLADQLVETDDGVTPKTRLSTFPAGRRSAPGAYPEHGGRQLDDGVNAWPRLERADRTPRRAGGASAPAVSRASATTAGRWSIAASPRSIAPSPLERELACGGKRRPCGRSASTRTAKGL